MKSLLKKEFALCAHPTSFLFLAFALFVFIPNYPYEVMFFFSGLSVFFVSLTARENGDTAFTVSLPVAKKSVPLARILFCVTFQCALLFLAGITTMIKELAFSPEAQVNMAGMMANIAFLGFGAVILGVFNLIFFPLFYRNPNQVGIPFVIASVAEFFLIALIIAFRFTVPLFRDILNTGDSLYLPAKMAALVIGVAVYVGFTVLSVRLSQKNFLKTDL